jgi:predicted O-linked N-acetylglucosamine transferase (SPINDLY family)
MPDLTLQQARDLGIRLFSAGQLDRAQSVFDQILARVPDDAESIHLLGLVAGRRGDGGRAIELITRAIALSQDSPIYHYNLADAYRSLGRIADAEASLRHAIALKPDFSEAHENLGAMLLMQGRPADAAEAFRTVLRIDPNNPTAHANLAHALRSRGLLEEATRHCRESVALAPNIPELHNQLGSLLRERGQVAEAVASFRRAVELRPDFPSAHSNLLFAMHFDPDCPPERLLAEHRAWAARHADPLTPGQPDHPNDPSPDRRLRIGYVSPDFRRHMVSMLMEPVIERHDRAAFEVVCYNGVPPAEADELTAKLRGRADLWRDVSAMSDEQLARQIREDRVDILIDLTLHMRRNRLGAFARRPAPVQATFIAYPSTSGMRAMDYAITDIHIDSPDKTEMFRTERLARLPDTLWCFARPEPDVELNDLPAARNGFVTFASLNSFAKVDAPTLTLWAQILAAVPNSRLLVLVTGGETGNPSLAEYFRRFGIDSGGVRLVPGAGREEYLRYYHDADITLDPLHYAGHTTSLDSLYMGVPVVTLPGRHPVSRAGLTYLRNLDHTEWIASTPEQYVRIAADLASDLPRLARLRAELRDRMRRSPLMDVATYTRNLERLYRQMWHAWCSSR